MAKIFKTVLAILIFLVVAAAAGFAGYWSYFIHHWPWWIGLSMGLGVFGVYFLILFIKKYLVRRREKRFVQRIVDHGAVLDEGERPETQSILDLENSWKHYLEILKKSHLRKRGNPIYVLPWYIAMGESGVGKTTMLANAGITSSFTELEDKQGHIGATRNCDWVFFDSAIILDTAGRYSVPLASGQEVNEWKRFLLLLAKTRRKEPVNGIILFVAANDIMKNDRHALRKKAQVQRNRIHSLMRLIGYKIPVTVFVTRMDTVPGYTEFVTLLEEQDRSQAMGKLNSQNTPHWQDVLAQTFSSLRDGLERIRLAEVARPSGRNASFFTLPTQLQPLEEGLESFLAAMFTENSYQETPVIQGIFVGSGICSQAPLPDFLQQSQKTDSRPVSVPYAAFARDVFSRVLPENQWRLQPVREMLLWRRITRRLAVVAWLCLLAFAGGGLGLSYLHNQNVLADFPRKAETISLQQPGSNSAIVALEKMRLNILNIIKKDSQWPLPLQIYPQASNALAAYKREYCELFESTLLTPMEEGFEGVVDTVADKASDDVYAEYVAYVVEQINYLKQYLTGEKPPEFQSFGRVAAAVLAIKNPDLLSEVGKYFPDLNASYLAWNLDVSDNEERLARLRDTLQGLLQKNRGEVSWLYADSIADSPSITLADFWKNRQVRVAAMATVPGAFTNKGRDNIAAFLRAIEKSGVDKAVFAELQQGYNKSYPLQFIHSWREFGNKFAEGELELSTDFEWRDAAIFMTSPRNPYFTLLETMSRELLDFRKDTGTALPSWATSLLAMDKVRQLSSTEKNSTEASHSSLTEKVSAEKSRIASEVLRQVDPARSAALNEELRMAQAWEQYEKGLTALNGITPFKEKAAVEFTAWFNEANGSKEQSLFSAVYSSWMSLKTLGSSTYPSDFVWKLIYGPFSFLQDFAAYNTAMVLQEKWHEEVLAAVVGVDPQKISPLLFDNDKGVVWKFLADHTVPFITQSETGYKARKVYGRSLVFTPEFYSFINQAKAVVVNREPTYQVILETQPIEVNQDARVEPLYATLSMKCAKDSYLLENDNFPRSMSIEWSPENCGDVSLVIGFPDMQISKVWNGELAFARFLKQFQTGSYRFPPGEFANHTGYLRNQNINYIGLSYIVSGEKDVVQLLNASPDTVPKNIIYPDGQLSARPYYETEPARSQPQPLKAIDEKPVNPPENLENKVAEGSGEPHGSSWILQQDPWKYTVQVMSLRSEAAVSRGFLLLAGREEKAFFSKLAGGVKWYILCAGVFNNSVEAGAYVESLPPSIQRIGPVIRTFAGIQKEIQEQSKPLVPKKSGPLK